MGQPQGGEWKFSGSFIPLLLLKGLTAPKVQVISVAS